MRKLFSIILFVVIIINIIFGTLIYLFYIQNINSPKITANIEIINYDSEKITLRSTLDVYNSNPFDISIEDIKIQSFVKENITISEIDITGGVIPSKKNKSFLSVYELKFKNQELTDITNIITGKIGFYFQNIIKKTIPIELTVVTILGDILKNISIPQFILELNLVEINESGLNFGGLIQIINPNSFDLLISKIDLNILDENDNQVGRMNLTGGTIRGQNNLSINISGNINFTALNSELLKFIISGLSGIKIGGFNHSIPFLTETDIHIPDFKDIFSINEELELTLSFNFKFTLKGLLIKIGFMIYNPTSLPLSAVDLKSSIYRIDGTNQEFIVIKDMDSCTISANNEAILFANLTIPYLDFIFMGNGKIIPDSIKLKVEGNFLIKDIDQKIPFIVNGIFDINLLR